MWYLNKIKELNKVIEQDAKKHQDCLTKPQGSLGKLEDLAIRLSSRQQIVSPKVDNIQITVFAGDHGIANEGVSAFPQVVTAEMVKNFARGGAAISVLANQYKANFEIVDVGVAFPIKGVSGVVNSRVANGTKNFSIESAMTEDELHKAMKVGKGVVERMQDKNIQLFVGGEMGIANTTSATAIFCALLNKSASELTGSGTGLNDEGVKNKVLVINKALEKHRASAPLEVLKTYGGFEIAALVGSYIACAQQGVTILVDGFITTAAALLAVRINPEVKKWMEFTHQSAEQGHRLTLQELNVSPLLDLDMRLGEGSGAAVSIGLFKSACALHNGMATFEAAGVSEE